MNEFYLKVKINGEMPDFRVFMAFFFGDDFHNVDSDGNAYPVWSRNWTELYMRSREIDAYFDIYPENKEEKILKITSNSRENVSALAYFLAKETNGEVLDADNQPIPKEKLQADILHFDLEKRLQLAQQSIWRQSSAENPYPNLSNSEK